MLIHEVANKLNISKRSIRYYEQLGLIDVEINEENGYRMYEKEHLKALQTIVYYRSLEISLKDIQQLLIAEDNEIKAYLQRHLKALQQQQSRLTAVIEQLQLTINELEEHNMSKNFEQQKQQWIDENEAKYGEEIRNQHGEDSVLASYGKLKEMTEEQYEAAEGLQQMLFERLQEAMIEESEELLLEIAELHKRWLSFYWPKYTKEAHVGLAQMYVADERFTNYYDSRVADGATELLFEAIILYSKQ